MAGLPKLPLLPLLWTAAVISAASASPEQAWPTAGDDECYDAGTRSGECALNALQRRGAKVSSASPQALSDGQLPDASLAEDGAESDDEAEALRALRSGEGTLNAVFTDAEVEAIDAMMRKETASPINLFNDQLDSWKSLGKGEYYEFQTSRSQLVFESEVEGRPGSWLNAESPVPLASASKLFTGFAAMVTMELKPRDWYPTKWVYKFKGWENFRNFPVHNSTKKADLNIYHLLTHTSGLPFGMRMSKKDIEKQTLFYWPGTNFGYTLGHRVVGWLLRDYWTTQPETKHLHLRTVQDVYKWLVFDKLGLSPKTKFSTEMTHLFGYEGEAADASIQSTGHDLMKLAVVALRKGRLPSGKRIISEKNWNKWAIPNLLPGGKLSKNLVSWQGADASWLNWNVGGLKVEIMKQSGDYGWNYFGATYNHSKDIGWCGFFSSCLRVTYSQDLAFVIMQRDVADLKKSKPFLLRYFDKMAKSLQCRGSRCHKKGSTGSTVFCETRGKALMWSRRCPIKTTRGKGWRKDTYLDPKHYTCYVPTCSR